MDTRHRCFLVLSLTYNFPHTHRKTEGTSVSLWGSVFQCEPLLLQALCYEFCHSALPDPWFYLLYSGSQEALPGFLLPALQPGNSQGSRLGVSQGFASLASCSQGTTCVLAVVTAGRISLVLIAPSWPLVAVLFLFLNPACITLQESVQTEYSITSWVFNKPFYCVQGWLLLGDKIHGNVSDYHRHQFITWLSFCTHSSLVSSWAKKAFNKSMDGGIGRNRTNMTVGRNNPYPEYTLFH